MARRLIIVEDFYEDSRPIEEVLTAFQDKGLKAYIASSVFSADTSPAEIAEIVETAQLSQAEQSVVETLLRQKTLLENELRKYRTLIENSGDLMYAVDFGGNITFVSDNIIDFLGYRPEELIGHNFLEVIPPEYHSRIVENFRLRSYDSIQGVTSLELHAKDGRRFPVEISGRIYLENNIPVLNIGLVRDVSARKAMEAQVVKRNRELTALYSVASVLNQPLDLNHLLQQCLDRMLETMKVETGGMMLIDHSGVFRQGAQRGFSEEFQAFFAPLLNDDKLMHRVLSEGEVVIFENLAVLPQIDRDLLKRTGYRSLVIGPLQAKDQILGGYVLASKGRHQFVSADHDLILSIGKQVGLALQAGELYGELNLTVAELRIANTQLEQATLHKSEFLANMSHELRTPLNAIIGFSELLQDQTFGPLNPKQERYINNILTSGKHLLALVNDVLDLSKVEAGKMELQLEKFSPRDLVNDVFNNVASLATQKRIALATHLGAPDQTEVNVTGDRGRIKQVLYNLLSNALKFTSENGSVEVTSTITRRNGDDWLELSVSDTGIGIKPEDIERIFEKFQMVDSTLSKRQQGTGLGLALSRELARLHGGDIRVQSVFGKGSIFTLVMPVEPLKPKPAEIPEQFPLTRTFMSLGEQVALVIEDEEQAAELLQLYMEQNGYRVVRCARGDQALQRARELQPSVITLDIVLPHKNGWDVLRELKADPTTRNIPVLVVSMIDNYESGFALGAVASFVKPVRKEELSTKLAELQQEALHVRRRKHLQVQRETGEPLRALVIDDSPLDRELIVQALTSAGLEVQTAENGESGWKMAQDNPPDLVVLDLMLPGLDGFGVLRRLRQNPATVDVPVFVYTAKELDAAERNQLQQAEAVLKKGARSGQSLLEAVTLLNGSE